MEETEIKLGKSRAIDLVKDEYRTLCDRAENITYACKNRTWDNYWANPNPDVLNHGWLLILDDYIGGQLHLFFVEANTIDEDRIKTRRYNNKYGRLLHIEILYDDPDFKDRFKGYKFLPHYKVTIKYRDDSTRPEDS